MSPLTLTPAVVGTLQTGQTLGINGMLLTNSAAGTVPWTVIAALSQSADLADLKDSAGNLLLQADFGARLISQAVKGDGGSFGLLRPQLRIDPTATAAVSGEANIMLAPNDLNNRFAQGRTAIIQFHPERGYEADATLKAHRHYVNTTLNGQQTLPTGTITVVDTTGFATAGTAWIYRTDGTLTSFSYTGKTATTLTGCTGGSGTFANGSMVVSDQISMRHIQFHTTNGSGALIDRLFIEYGKDDPAVQISSAHLKFADDAYFDGNNNGEIDIRAKPVVTLAAPVMFFKQTGDGISVSVGRRDVGGPVSIRPSASGGGGFELQDLNGNVFFDVDTAFQTTLIANASNRIPLTIKLAGSQTASAFEVRDSGNALLARFDATGVLEFGGDSNLYRLAANTLKTDDELIATANGLATKTKAGAPVDGDFWTPTDGLLVVDSTNNKIWARVGGAWKGVVIA